MTKINDWKPETKSLIERLVAAGCAILAGNNGGDEEFAFTGDLDAFIEELIACDEGHLYVSTPTAKRRWLWLILGNSPGEIVSDYQCDDALDAVTDAHYAEWELKGQPLKWA
jgi:hypothetical protein